MSYESAVADDPTFGPAGQAHAVQRAQTKFGTGRFDRAAADRTRGAGASDDHARGRVEKIASQPALSVVGRERAPTAAAVVGGEHADRKQRRRLADRPAVL